MVFIMRRLKEKYNAKGKKLYMCFVDLEKTFDIVKESVEIDNEEKGIFLLQ